MRSVYEYTNDVDDRLLEIRDCIDEVLLKITHSDGGKIAGVSFPDDEAPAVALAILEAAGIDDDSEMFAASAVRNLRRVAEIRAEKAEREAEDAKVHEFRKSSLVAIASVSNEPNADAKDWAELSGTGREGWRAHYRAARKFFEES